MASNVMHPERADQNNIWSNGIYVSVSLNAELMVDQKTTASRASRYAFF